MKPTVGRPALRRPLGVWMNGLRVGTWTVMGGGGHAFAYDPDWLAHPAARPLSLSLPLAQGEAPFRGEVVEAYFDNLLPDSADIRRRIAQHYGVGDKAFDLLAHIGRDCVGAVQLLPPDADPPDVRRIEARPLTEAGVVAQIDRAVRNQPLGMADAEDELRISLAGAQEKTALLWHQGQWCAPSGATPTTHILKLPLGKVGGVRADFSTSVENEWLCARVLAAYELRVAPCEIGHFGPHKVLVVTRFDRSAQPDGWLARIPQEDFCQVNGLPSSAKYQEHGGPGIDRILDTLRGSQQAEQDRRDFLAAQLVFWLLAAPDGHAKNFSLFIKPGGRFRLTPFYDVMSAWPAIGPGPNQFDRKKLKLAMAVKGKSAHYRLDDIQRRHWNATAKRNALGADFEAGIERVLRATPGVLDSLARELPPDFPAQVSEPIFRGIQAQADRLARMAPGLASLGAD